MLQTIVKPSVVSSVRPRFLPTVPRVLSKLASSGVVIVQHTELVTDKRKTKNEKYKHEGKK